MGLLVVQVLAASGWVSVADMAHNVERTGVGDDMDMERVGGDHSSWAVELVGVALVGRGTAPSEPVLDWDGTEAERLLSS